MARISTYPLDSVLQAKDKFIGTDITGSTINVTADMLVDFINTSGTLQGNNSARFKFSSTPGSNKPNGIITLEEFINDNVAFSEVDHIVISRYSVADKDFREYFPAIMSSRIVIQKASDISVFAVFAAFSQNIILGDEDFHRITLQYVTGNGSLEDGEDYILSLLQYVGEGEDKHHTHDQSVPESEWTINHNLEKRPSVVVVDSAEDVVYGDIRYIDNNTVTLTFAGAFSGKAYFN